VLTSLPSIQQPNCQRLVRLVLPISFHQSCNHLTELSGLAFGFEIVEYSSGQMENERATEQQGKGKGGGLDLAAVSLEAKKGKS